MLAETALIRIIRCVLNHEYPLVVTGKEDWQSIIQVAQKHGLLTYVYYYAKGLDPDSRPDQELSALLGQRYAAEVRRDILQLHAIEQMKSEFDRSGIDNLFFKGSVTKTRYGNEMLRSMGDIDFLYKAEQDAALKDTMKRLGFQYVSNGRVHDIYTRDPWVVAEAHRELLSPRSRYAAFAKNIWKRARLIPNYRHNYEMQIEDEILFNMIHLASHFKKGGAGIRFIVDVWVYAQQEADWNYIESELQRLGLDQFYRNVSLLADRWFGEAECETPVVTAMEDYILTGGIFGLKKNRDDSVIAGGRLPYLKRVLFPSFKDMQSMFPWLKHKWFLPCAWIVRIIESLIKRKDNVNVLLQPFYHGDKQNASALAAFYNSCGL